MSSKYWSIKLISISISLVFLYGLTVVIVDPYFHFHKPLNGLAYNLGNERFINDGILRHFEYDTLITGTSMTENFKTSECDKLLGGRSVKVPLHGAYYNEVTSQTERALQYNHNVNRVIRGIDYNALIEDSAEAKYETYPSYLYDTDIVNDVFYVFNKDLFLDLAYVFARTIAGKEMTSFDEYEYWSDNFRYGREVVLQSYRSSEKRFAEHLSDGEKKTVVDNVQRNLIKIALDNPDIEFIYFYTPYSIYYWASLNEQNGILRQLEAEKVASECMFEVPNIRLFSFYDDTNVICNADNYKDNGHYGGWINSYVLQSIADNQHEITKNNYDDFWNKECEFYLGYNYKELF